MSRVAQKYSCKNFRNEILNLNQGFDNHPLEAAIRKAISIKVHQRSCPTSICTSMARSRFGFVSQALACNLGTRPMVYVVRRGGGGGGPLKHSLEAARSKFTNGHVLPPSARLWLDQGLVLSSLIPKLLPVDGQG